MPKFEFNGNMHVACQVWIEADTLEDAVAMARKHDTFDAYDLNESPQWFVWNEDTVQDDDGNELEFE